MTKLRSIVAITLVVVALILIVVACSSAQGKGDTKPTPTPIAANDPVIDYTVTLIVDYRTSKASDVHIRRYGDVYVWSNEQQVISHVMHSSTRDWNEVETRLSGKTLVVVYKAKTSNLLFPHLTTGVARANVHLSIAESTQYVGGEYEYIVAITEY